MPIDQAINELFKYIFCGENLIFVNFFSNSKSDMRVYWPFFGAKLRIFFFYTFFRIVLRKINILKQNKLYTTELNEVYGANKK